MADIIISGPEERSRQESFGQILYEALQNGGSRIALIDGVTGEKRTYNELLQHTISLAQYLKNMGLEKHDAISICSENSLNYTIPLISATYLGLIVAPISHFYIKSELEHALNLSKPKVIFCTSNLVDTFINISQKHKYIKKIIIINKCNKVPASVLRLQDILQFQAPDNFAVTKVKPDDVIAILCSSGTTGLPKGVMLPDQGFNKVLYCLQNQLFGNFTSESTRLCILPFFHATGLVIYLCSIILHSKVVVLPKFEENLFLKTIQNYKISTTTLAPPLLLFLSKSPLVEQYDLSSLKEIFSGAAPLSKSIQNAVQKRLNVDVRQGYGLTELTLVATLQPAHDSHLGSVGILVPGMQCKVIDMKTGISLGPNQPGELLFRGAQVMKGYVQNPKATAESIEKDGWLHTGDVGYYDQEQFFYIVDRCKELIKYKGFQVPPAEIEEIILNLPDVLDCAVIGKPDDEAGELPYAFIVRKPGSTITEKQVYDHVAENVSYHKRLKGGMKFVDTIPKSPAGKILRRVLRDLLANPMSKL